MSSLKTILTESVAKLAEMFNDLSKPKTVAMVFLTQDYDSVGFELSFEESRKIKALNTEIIKNQQDDYPENQRKAEEYTKQIEEILDGKVPMSSAQIAEAFGADREKPTGSENHHLFLNKEFYDTYGVKLSQRYADIEPQQSEDINHKTSFMYMALNNRSKDSYFFMNPARQDFGDLLKAERAIKFAQKELIKRNSQAESPDSPRSKQLQQIIDLNIAKTDSLMNRANVIEVDHENGSDYLPRHEDHPIYYHLEQSMVNEPYALEDNQTSFDFAQEKPKIYYKDTPIGFEYTEDKLKGYAAANPASPKQKNEMKL